CTTELYRMARENCAHIFPNLDVRFDYPGKCGQIRLFRATHTAHPPTACYDSVKDWAGRPPALSYPLVLKLAWGGQGETVYHVPDGRALKQTLERVRAFERSGQPGFLVQALIPNAGRCLRVVKIGHQYATYWRVMPDGSAFAASVAAGARIDHDADPHLRAAGQAAAAQLCRKTGLDLAGFDLLFDHRSMDQGRVEPLMLEINYYFGRTGLGGSERYYVLLTRAVDHWLETLGLTRGR
ncbi:MAG: glutathione synthase, partial [Desulfatitalea sp.]|nr:glutathione synthase [Desulfatitalea sp.]